jgi:hypothetical protein
VEDFMPICGRFQVHIFIYHDWTNRHGEVKNMELKDIPPELISDGKTTEIFIPQGSGTALGIRRPGFILPFQKKCVCIFYKTTFTPNKNISPRDIYDSACLSSSQFSHLATVLPKLH